MTHSALAHYASPYYDPVKAHEYYMRTRELKGRRPTSSLNDEGKKVWSYTKDQITTEKKEKLQAEADSRKQNIQALRDKAAETRKSISESLKKMQEIVSQWASGRRETIGTAKQAEIDALKAQEIPKGLSKEERAERIAKRDAEIAKIRDKAKSDNDYVTRNSKSLRAENSWNASKKRETVAAELKSAISAAREVYAAAKDSITASYENIYQQEFDKIVSEYGKKPKKKSGK